MRSRTIFSILGILIIVVLIANWIIAQKAEKRIEEELEKISRDMEETTVFTYSDLSVSPIFSKASLGKVKVDEGADGDIVKCEKITVGCSYSDAIKLAKGEGIEGLSSANITLDGLDYRSERMNRRISVERMKYDFDGHITGNMIGTALLGLPDESQRLGFSLHNMTVDDPDLFRGVSMVADDEEKITTIEDASLSIFYDPDSKEVSVDHFEIDTPVASMHISGSVKYSGNSLLDLGPQRVRFEVDFEMTPDGITVGKPDESGRFSLEKIKLTSDAEFDLEGFSKSGLLLPEGKTTLLVEGLTGQFSGRLRRNLEMTQIGRMTEMSMDEITVDKFSAEYSYEDAHLVLSDTELLTPFLKAYLDAEVDIDEADPDNSVIRTAELKVKDISRDVRGALVGLERFTGQTMKEDEDEFVLTASGTLGNPVFGSSGEAAAPRDETQLSRETVRDRQYDRVSGGDAGVVPGRTGADLDEGRGSPDTLTKKTVRPKLVEEEPSPVPTIRSVDPPQITTGKRTLLTISGSDLQGATAVTMDGTAMIENPPAVNADGTELTVYITVPEGRASGSSVVTVYTPLGTPQTQVPILELPSIESVDPTELQPGQRTLVTIKGRNLTGAMAVTTDMAAVIENPPAVNDAGNQLTAYITLSEGQSAESATLTVLTPQGSPTFTVSVSKQVAITSVEPEEIFIGQLEALTITGENLETVTDVSIDRDANIDQPPEVNRDGTQLTVIITVKKGQAGGPATLTLHTPSGNPEAEIMLVEKAEAAGVEPRRINIGERRRMTITGKNLQGATEVTINRSATVGNPPRVNQDGTRLTFSLMVPDGQKAGPATLTVHTPTGNPEVKLTLVEQPKGALQIDANIRGGECYINGKLMGTKTIPNYVKLLPGHYTVKIVQPECPPGVFEYGVDVIVNQEVQKFFELECNGR